MNTKKQSPRFVLGVFKAALLSVLVVTVAGCQTVGFLTPKTSSSQRDKIFDPSPDHKMNGAERTLQGAGEKAEATHKFDVAANAFGRLFERRPYDAAVLASFIRTMRYSDRSVEITQYVEQKTQHLINDPDVRFEYAKALLAAGRKTDSLKALQVVAKMMPENWQVYSALGIAHDEMKQFSKAIPAYKTALRLSPENVVVMNNLAMSYALSGHLKIAISTLENAATLDRRNTHVRQNLALLYAVNGDVEKAKSLAAMDLNASELESNLSFYRRFEGASNE